MSDTVPAIADAPSSESSPADPKADGAALRPSRRTRLLRGLAIGGGLGFCMLTSAAISTLINDPSPAPQSKAPPSRETETAPRVEVEKESHDPLERIDHLLESNSYSKAIAISNAMLEPATPLRQKISLSYRMALCLEGSSQWNEAQKEFSELARMAQGEPWQLLAQCGRLRCLVKLRKHREAEVLAAQLQLRLDHPSASCFDLRGDLLHWIACSQVLELHESRDAPPFPAPTVRSADYSSAVAMYLQWARTSEEFHFADSSVEENAVPHVDLESENVLQSLVSFHRREFDIRSFLEEIGRSTRLQLEIAPEIADRMHGVQGRFAITAVPLADVLTLVAIQHRGVWRLAGNRLQIGEAPAHRSLEGIRESTLVALRKAEVFAPEHPFSHSGRLEIGNLMYEDGRIQAAIRQYENVLSSVPGERVTRLSEYNLGLALLTEGARSRAREMFLNVIDRDSRDELAGCAWWFLCRTDLDSGDESRALRSLRQASSHASPQGQAMATLGLCAARLMASADLEAHLALRQGPRSLLREEPARSEAAFLDAFARFRIARSKRARPVEESEDLLSALVELTGNSILGPIGEYLRGQAYRELGLESEMARSYENCLSGVVGPLAIRMVHEVARFYIRAGRLKDAHQWLLTLQTAGDDSVAAWAAMQLAEVAMRMGRYTECLTRCRALLTNPMVTRDAVLRTMSRCYELQGDFQKAVDCLNGKPPSG